jgi:hypothetical protein
LQSRLQIGPIGLVMTWNADGMCGLRVLTETCDPNECQGRLHCRNYSVVL